MTAKSKTRPDYASIGAWLRWATIGIVGLALLSAFVLYKIALDVQIHAEHLRQSTRLQSINAGLARDVTRAWLHVTSGRHDLAAPALSELKQHRRTIGDIVDDFHTLDDAYPPTPDFHAHPTWEKMLESITRMITIAEPLVAQGRTPTSVANGVLSPFKAINQPAYRNFMRHLRSAITTCQYAGAQSFANVRWVLQNLCSMTLAIIAALALYGLFFFLFVNFRIGARTADVTNRILQYTSRLPEPVDDKPGRDEFGTIELKIDECAQAIYGRQTTVAQEHEKTLKQLKSRTEELSKLNEALRASGRALVRFLTDVSHDLRTPLAIMIGESEVSLRSQTTSTDEYKETLSRMLDQTRYLGSLVDQLLYTARSRVSAVPLKPQYVDVPELVRNACRDMTTLAASRNVEIKLHDTSTRNIVLGDQTRLREMMLTIIDNAIEYSKENGSIVVSISEQSSNLTIAVTDSGIGIPSNELPMIFRRFYRAQNAPDANPQGTGIGLAVAKGIVESHDGTIDINSQKDIGTTVTLVLPIVDKRKRNPSETDQTTASGSEPPAIASLTTA
ncbi:MAG: HAMP domain-containing histidine kinase [Hyphomicrobiaceae bacterium]